MNINFARLIVSIGLPLAAGVIGSAFTTGAIDTWYATLEKPAFNPPNWIFGPVWTILYILMGISLYLIWQKGFKKNFGAIKIFFAQLILNSLWSIIFFSLQNPLFALFEIIFLWIAIVLTIRAFYKIDKTAAYLLLPYSVWVTSASILNLSIVLLN